jgi:peroxiredoxin
VGDRPLAVIDLRPASDARDDDATMPGDEKDPARILYAGVMEDGNRFGIDNVLAGDYVLHVTIRAAHHPQTCVLPVALANATVPVQVTPGRENAPLAIGTLRLKSVNFARPGQPAPEIQGRTTDGKEFSLSHLHGKVVLLSFRAKWCSICRSETAHLKNIAEQHGGPGGLAIVGINLDEKPEAAREYVDKNGISWPNVFPPGGPGEANPVLRAYGVSGIPSYWLIGRDGRVIARDIPSAKLDQEIEDALKK